MEAGEAAAAEEDEEGEAEAAAGAEEVAAGAAPWQHMQLQQQQQQQPPVPPTAFGPAMDPFNAAAAYGAAAYGAAPAAAAAGPQQMPVYEPHVPFMLVPAHGPAPPPFLQAFPTPLQQAPAPAQAAPAAPGAPTPAQLMAYVLREAGNLSTFGTRRLLPASRQRDSFAHSRAATAGDVVQCRAVLTRVTALLDIAAADAVSVTANYGLPFGTGAGLGMGTGMGMGLVPAQPVPPAPARTAAVVASHMPVQTYLASAFEAATASSSGFDVDSLLADDGEQVIICSR